VIAETKIPERQFQFLNGTGHAGIDLSDRIRKRFWDEIPNIL
jgi:hypothetical protein